MRFATAQAPPTVGDRARAGWPEERVGAVVMVMAPPKSLSRAACRGKSGRAESTAPCADRRAPIGCSEPPQREEAHRGPESVPRRMSGWPCSCPRPILRALSTSRPLAAWPSRECYFFASLSCGSFTNTSKRLRIRRLESNKRWFRDRDKLNLVNEVAGWQWDSRKRHGIENAGGGIRGVKRQQTRLSN